MYADFTFYRDVYFGEALTSESVANRWLDRASDYVDEITFRRLETAFPTDEHDTIKIKKAVCAVADALYFVDTQRKANSAQVGADGKITGTVASMSSGKESITYATGSTASVYSKAAGSKAEQDSYIYSVAETYLANVPDANGVNLLYAGVS